MTTDLLDRLEALVEFARNGFNRVPGLVSLEAIESIIADERKRREPVQMSCPSCCNVTPCFESREMCCSECLSMFETPEQLDANLDADRKARGMPAVEHKPTTPDPRDALLAQAREALYAGNRYAREATDYGDSEIISAIAAIDKYKKATRGKV